jgi:hypothetical protein
MKAQKAAAPRPRPAIADCDYPVPEEIEAAQGAVPSASWFAPAFVRGTPHGEDDDDTGRD